MHFEFLLHYFFSIISWVTYIFIPSHTNSKYAMTNININIIPNICQSDTQVCRPVSASPSHSPADSTIVRRYDRNLRAKQQRLLILCHCATCTRPNCKIRASHALLLKHMSTCKTLNCNHRHCSSSRRILIHFQSCKDERCEKCFPLRAMLLMKNRDRRNIMNCMDCMTCAKALTKRSSNSSSRDIYMASRNPKRTRRVRFNLPNEEPAIKYPGC